MYGPVVDFHFCKDIALVSLLSQSGRADLHLGVKPSSWLWGHKHDPFRKNVEYFGFGPLFLLVVA